MLYLSFNRGTPLLKRYALSHPSSTQIEEYFVGLRKWPVRFLKGSVDDMFEELRDRGTDTNLVNFALLGP